MLIGKEPTQKLINIDIWNNNLDLIKVKKQKKCPTCNGEYPYLEGKKVKSSVKICGSCNYQIKLDGLNMNEVFNKLSKLNGIQTNENCLILNELILFKSGRALVKAKTKEKAKAIVDRYLG